jgi:hypothetical protein
MLMYVCACTRLLRCAVVLSPLERRAYLDVHAKAAAQSTALYSICLSEEYQREVTDAYAHLCLRCAVVLSPPERRAYLEVHTKAAAL